MKKLIGLTALLFIITNVAFASPKVKELASSAVFIATPNHWHALSAV